MIEMNPLLSRSTTIHSDNDAADDDDDDTKNKSTLMLLIQRSVAY